MRRRPLAEGQDNPYFDKIKSKTCPVLVLNQLGIDKVSELASIGCSCEEIASCIHVSYDTCINERNKETFERAVKEGHDGFSCAIRHQAYNIMMGEKGNVTMTIFLCKAVLHMRDNEPQPVLVSPISDALDRLYNALKEDGEIEGDL